MISRPIPSSLTKTISFSLDLSSAFLLLGKEGFTLVLLGHCIPDGVGTASGQKLIHPPQQWSSEDSFGSGDKSGSTESLHFSPSELLWLVSSLRNQNTNPKAWLVKDLLLFLEAVVITLHHF